MSLRDTINHDCLPAHIAIIMDGNGRWATQRGEDRIFGHRQGVESVRQVIEGAAEIGVSYLTLYAFSTENWNRPWEEVEALMEIMVDSLNNECDTLIKNNIVLRVIGDIERLSPKVRNSLDTTLRRTSECTGMVVAVALSYSARWEILNAARELAREVKKGTLEPEDIDKDNFEKHLTTSGLPDPSLLVRTSGELRISNFLLWQMAYTEFYFTETLWPDFGKEDLYRAVLEYQKRERRFGKTSEQIHDEEG